MKFIENSNEGVHCYNRFSADFSDDVVKLNNRDYPLGTVSKMTANIPKSEMDEILKLGGKALNCYQTISVLGYNRNVFLIHKGVILDMLSYMKKLEIFQCFDYEESKKLIDDLLSEESLDQYEDFLSSEKPLTEERVLELKKIKKRYAYAIELGLIYAYIGIDTANFATAVQNFTVKLMEKTSRQKSELAKTAFELFNDELFMCFLEQSNPAGKIMWGFSVKSMNTVVPVIDEVNGEHKILRRVYFSRMMDFFVMDLFEALSHGHYLWQCGICGKYFLMTTAHRQLYCEEKNPKSIRRSQMGKRSHKRNRIRPFEFSGRKETTPSDKEKAATNTATLNLKRQRNILWIAMSRRRLISIMRRSNTKRIWN